MWIAFSPSPTDGARRLLRSELWSGRETIDQSTGDGSVGQRVDQDEAAGLAVLPVGVERRRPVERDVTTADSFSSSVLAAAARAC